MIAKGASVRKFFTLTGGTIKMLKRQAKEAHLSQSAMVRTLILRNEGGKI